MVVCREKQCMIIAGQDHRYSRCTTAVPHLLDKERVTGETLAPLFMRKSHTVAHLKSSKMASHLLFSTLQYL